MSREADLYKDKIEVSLDGRQIFYLFFGGAVIVGLVFVLGVMVGAGALGGVAVMALGIRGSEGPTGI